MLWIWWVSFSFLLSFHPTSILGRNKVLCLMQRPYTLWKREREREEAAKQRKGRSVGPLGSLQRGPYLIIDLWIYSHSFCLFHCVPQSPKTDGFLLSLSLSLVGTFAKWGKMVPKWQINTNIGELPLASKEGMYCEAWHHCCPHMRQIKEGK